MSYADFITLLFVFFTTLYAIEFMDHDEGERLVTSIRQSFGVRLLSFGSDAPGIFQSELAEPIRLGDRPGGLDAIRSPEAQTAMIRQKAQNLTKDPEKGVSVRDNERGLVISLADTQFFEPGAVGLSASAASAIGEIAELLKELPNYVRVEGHTDDRPVRGGRIPSNWHLSALRAVNVVRELEQAGVPSYRLAASGFADQVPLESNSSAEGRARNRRVDLVILRTQLAEAGR